MSFYVANTNGQFLILISFYISTALRTVKHSFLYEMFFPHQASITISSQRYSIFSLQVPLHQLTTKERRAIGFQPLDLFWVLPMVILLVISPLSRFSSHICTFEKINKMDKLLSQTSPKSRFLYTYSQPHLIFISISKQNIKFILS